jgi:hypothetical protein
VPGRQDVEKEAASDRLGQEGEPVEGRTHIGREIEIHEPILRRMGICVGDP